MKMTGFAKILGSMRTSGLHVKSVLWQPQWIVGHMLYAPKYVLQAHPLRLYRYSCVVKSEHHVFFSHYAENLHGSKTNAAQVLMSRRECDFANLHRFSWYRPTSIGIDRHFFSNWLFHSKSFSTFISSGERETTGRFSVFPMTNVNCVKICKRNVGRSSENNNHRIFNISVEKNKLRDRSKPKISGRVTFLKSNLLLQKRNIKAKLSVHRTKGALAVHKLHRKFKSEIKEKISQKENVKTLPNLLTTLRMCSAPALAYWVVNESFGLAFSVFVLAGITDLLDGYIARNFKNQRTALGTALDPLADKLLISFLTVSLTTAGLIPVPLTVLILSRDAGLILGSFYIRWISLRPPRTVARYFDVSHVTAKLYPSNISKINTGLQLLYVASTLASPVFDFVGHPLLQVLMYTTGVTTFLSGADYILTWRKRLKIFRN